MKLIPIHNSRQYAKVDDEDYDNILTHKWVLVGIIGNSSSLRDSVNKVNMSNLVMNTKDMLDHKDGDFTNNQKDNLRLCNQSQNMANREKYISVTTTSKYKGVYFNKEKKKWHARVKKNRKHNSAGYHLKEDDAAMAYNKLALKLFGEFAVLNEIKEGAPTPF